MESPTPKRPNAAIYGVAAVLALAITGAAVWRTCGAGFSTDDPTAALSMTEGGPDIRFRETSPLLPAGAPKAVRFDFPAGSENGALTKGSADGITGIGGPNTSLGDPVFAVADGKVIFAGRYSAELGNVVVIAHTGPDGKPLRSFYGHLHKSETTAGSLVGRGTKIGTMGTADGRHPAGLLFSLESGEGILPPATGSPAPREVLGKLRNAAPEALAPSALSRM